VHSARRNSPSRLKSCASIFFPCCFSSSATPAEVWAELHEYRYCHVTVRPTPCRRKGSLRQCHAGCSSARIVATASLTLRSKVQSLTKRSMTLSESFPSPRLPKTVKRTPAPAAKPNLSFNGNNCSTATTRPTLISNLPVRLSSLSANTGSQVESAKRCIACLSLVT
jgi:hypothetical protein